jgi:hypothetical protein
MTMRIDVLTIDFHLGAVMEDALDHRGHLRGGRRLQLAMYAQRIAFDVPVDHDTASAIADVPLGCQILIPGAEMLGVRGAGRRPAPPDGRIAGMQGTVGDDGDGTAHDLDVEVAAAHVGQVLGRRARIQAGHTLQTGIGADPV